MYFVPLVILALIAIGIFFSPIAALILFVLALAALGAMKFAGRTEAEHAPPPAQTSPPANAPEARQTVTSQPDEEKKGLWGEVWPEQREENEGKAP